MVGAPRLSLDGMAEAVLGCMDRFSAQELTTLLWSYATQVGGVRGGGGDAWGQLLLGCQPPVGSPSLHGGPRDPPPPSFSLLVLVQAHVHPELFRAAFQRGEEVVEEFSVQVGGALPGGGCGMQYSCNCLQSTWHAASRVCYRRTFRCCRQ